MLFPPTNTYTYSGMVFFTNVYAGGMYIVICTFVIQISHKASQHRLLLIIHQGGQDKVMQSVAQTILIGCSSLRFPKFNVRPHKFIFQS